MSSKILKYLILLALVLLIVAIASFWFSGPSFREKDVAIEIEGPTQVTSGEEVVYKLKYENGTRSTLHDLDFAFFYPEGSVVLIDGQLFENYSEDFIVNELSSGEKGEKEFKAFLIGEKGSIRTAKAILSFRSGNLSSTFEKNTSLSTTITNAPITLTLATPPSAVSGANIQYILDYRNTSEEDASDLILEFDYPDGFIVREFDSRPTTGNNVWNINTLKKGSGGRITVSGSLSGKEGENKLISVKLKRKLSGEYVDYQKISSSTTISNPILNLEVLVNNSSDYSASLGDRLNYVVKYNNNSNIIFLGMNLVVKLEGDSFDFSTLNTNGGFYDDSTKTITWNSSVTPDFINFTPGMKGQVSFGIALKSSFPSVIPGASQDRFVKISAIFGTPNVPTGFSGNEVSVLSGLVTKITSQPTLNQLIYYNDPSFSSSGPWPLRAGEETILTVHWQLTNPGNDIDDAKVITKLLSGIEWDGLTQANNNLPVPVFNVNSREVIWSFPKLPYGTGVSIEKYEASFRIKVKPTTQQKGTSIQLIAPSQFTGTDNFTKQSVIMNKGTVGSGDLADRPREGAVQ